MVTDFTSKHRPKTADGKNTPAAGVFIQIDCIYRLLPADEGGIVFTGETRGQEQ